MAKTVFVDGNPSQQILGTIVNAAFLNALNNHRHRGLAVDGDGAIDFAVDTGAANAYAVALTPALTAHVPGMPIVIIAAHANTGASTVAVNGMAAVPIKLPNGSDPPANSIIAGGLFIVVYDGTNYQLISFTGIDRLPAGAMLDWPTETVPPGALERAGASLLRTTYAALFAVIGTLYGAADANHFNLPDDRGRVPRYWDHGKGLDPDAAIRTAVTATGATMIAGNHVGTEQADGFMTHGHQEKACGSSGSQGAELLYTFGDPGTWGALNVDTVATGGNETRPINKYVMPIIYY
jgi:microcystin-dependent protein